MENYYVAFYHGKTKKHHNLKQRLYQSIDFLIRLFTNSNYSHCEIVKYDGEQEGKSAFICWSASIRDGGLRQKRLFLPSERWELIPISEFKGLNKFLLSEVAAQRKYDFKGVFSFIFPFLKHNKNKWFCSEFCASALGLANPEKYTPASLYKYMKEKKYE